MALQHTILGWAHDKIIKCTWKMKWQYQTHSAFGNFSNLEKIPGITTLFLKLAEDDNLTGLQTITMKAFHMLISKRTTNIRAQSVTPKYHHWVSRFYFLFKCWKVLNLPCFFSTQIDHLNGLQTIVKLWTYCLWETVLSRWIRDSQHILNIESPALAQLSTIPHN